MAGFENDVMVAKNLNFDLAAAKPHLGIINAAGKLPIGTGNSSPTPEILGGSLTSPDNSITFGYSSPDITAVVNTSVVQDLHTARFIVSAGGLSDGANYGTIADAISAASAIGTNQTIFIQPGTYTENLTLVPGINLAAYNGDQDTPNVTIVGTCTLTAAGTVSISNIRLQTNGSFFLAVTGTLASIVNLNNCYLNASNNTGISFTTTSANAQINCNFCNGNLGTTGIGMHSSSSAGTLTYQKCNFTNTGASTTASSNSAGSVTFTATNLDFPVSSTGTGGLGFEHCNVDTASLNTTSYTANGSGSNAARYTGFFSGTASGISIGAGATLIINNSNVNSSNTNAITGAGTIQYSSVTFTGSSSVINTTTQTALYTNLGKYKASGQPAFLAYLASDVTDITGAGGTYTLGSGTALTEVFDLDGNFNTNGTFTAPVTGKYSLTASIRAIGATVATSSVLSIITSNRTFINVISRPAGSSGFNQVLTVLCDMDAADTATVTLVVSGEAGNTVDIDGDANPATYFCGHLVA